jgi:hypothetical protein
MLTKSFAEISPRRFLAAGSISVAAAWIQLLDRIIVEGF